MPSGSDPLAGALPGLRYCAYSSPRGPFGGLQGQGPLWAVRPVWRGLGPAVRSSESRPAALPARPGARLPKPSDPGGGAGGGHLGDYRAQVCGGPAPARPRPGPGLWERKFLHRRDAAGGARHGSCGDLDPREGGSLAER